MRTVEVVSLETVRRLGSYPLSRTVIGPPTMDMYSREYRREPERGWIAKCSNVDLIPGGAWKICSEERYLVDELGHSVKSGLRGMEHWPEWDGVYHVRFGESLEEPVDSQQPYFLLGGDNNHYHWLLNFVPRLMYLDVFASEFPDLKSSIVLVPDALPLGSLDILELFGLPRTRVRRVSARGVVRFKSLYAPRLFTSREFSPTVFGWLRSQVATADVRRASRRVIISRADAARLRNRRLVVNESEVIDALRPFGFEAHQLASLSMRDQIELFADSEIVVGPHGAGFANMAFSRPGSKAIVFENSWNHTFMLDMLTVGGIKGSILQCEDVVDTGYESQFAEQPHLSSEVRRNRDMHVDTKVLVAMVKSMLAT